ncbi:type VII toxin-antitoxin system HepT family RNase toxin [Selenihalanaerobacter shriftii]|uniref:Uncharacterized conserved protein YutE, UPF0331/DUF86 family n=1 Tax=Selenihalanaerobacter shriftii TaxID=142842 RepID=A0A1T4PHU1_9FIRM|nr:DUF86 domain-containing protein [Selenihalanaerobacter shriftii]SJZ90796.1 Uncharacterized conserved protein YutE, UPF0331/DUF86 family [Selenihalanaerobacter shriftii]
MTDEDIIQSRIEYIKKAEERLSKLAQLSNEDFLADGDAFAITEHHIRIALESLLDIGYHICVSNDLGKPEDNTEILNMLGDHKILTEDFAEQIKGMGDYRNRLVYMYNEVTGDELYNLLQNKLSDFKEFRKQISEYLENN